MLPNASAGVRPLLLASSLDLDTSSIRSEPWGSSDVAKIARESGFTLDEMLAVMSISRCYCGFYCRAVRRYMPSGSPARISYASWASVCTCTTTGMASSQSGIISVVSDADGMGLGRAVSARYRRESGCTSGSTSRVGNRGMPIWPSLNAALFVARLTSPCRQSRSFRATNRRFNWPRGITPVRSTF